MTPKLRVAILAGAVLLGAAAGWLSLGPADGAREAAGIPGLLWPPARELPQFSLTDQAGRPFTRDGFGGRWSLVFFGFTHCPDVCPTTLTTLAQAAATLRAEAHDYQIVFVSVDPQRDTPARIAEYVHYFDSEFLGLSGPDSQLERLARTVGAIYVRTPDADGQYEVDHSASVFIIDPAMRLVGALSPPLTAAGVSSGIAAIRRFVEEHS